MVSLTNKSRNYVYVPIFIFLLMSGALNGCAPFMPPQDLSPFEQTVFTPDSVTKLKTFSSVSSLAKIEVEIGDESFSGSHALFAETPNKLRAELLGLFGRPVYMLVSDGTSITYLLPDENRYFESPSTAENFYRLTRIPLDGDAFVGLLLGQLPSIGDTDFHADLDVDGYHVVTLSGAYGRSQELRYNLKKQLVVGRLWRDDHLLLTVKYSDFTAEGFATVVQLDFPESQVRASVEFDDPTVDGDIPAQRFELSIPAGANRIDLNRS